MMTRMMSFNNMDEFRIPKMKLTTRLRHMDEIDDTNKLFDLEEIHVRENLYHMFTLDEL
jgi:hypothetical protein